MRHRTYYEGRLRAAAGSLAASKGPWREFPVGVIQSRLQYVNLAALCETSGLAHRTLLRIKNGEQRYVSLGTLDQICTALGIHLDDVA